MGAAGRARQGMNLIDNRDPDVGEQCFGALGRGDEQDFQALWCDEQDVRRRREQGSFCRAGHVAVPFAHRQPHSLGHLGDAAFLIVQQRPERRHVEHRHGTPALGQHPGQHGKERGFGLAARGRSQNHEIPSVQHRINGLFLHRAQAREAQNLGDEIPNRRMQTMKCRVAHRSSSSGSSSSSASRTPRPSMAARSWNDRLGTPASSSLNA
jgi:hypothetical protein